MFWAITTILADNLYRPLSWCFVVKFKGIRAALCGDVFSAKMSKEHNNANIICMGGRVLGRELANMIVDTYLEAEFQGGRHADRIKKIHEIETM